MIYYPIIIGGVLPLSAETRFLLYPISFNKYLVIPGF